MNKLSKILIVLFSSIMIYFIINSNETRNIFGWKLFVENDRLVITEESENNGLGYLSFNETFIKGDINNLEISRDGFVFKGERAFIKKTEIKYVYLIGIGGLYFGKKIKDRNRSSTNNNNSNIN